VLLGDIENNKLVSNIKNAISISNRKIEEYSKIALQENDILVSCQGTIWKIALVERKDLGMIPSSQLAVIRPQKQKILPEFLLTALQSEQVRTQLQPKIRGSFIARIPRNELDGLIIPLPTLEKQKDVVHEFYQIRSEIQELEQLLREKKQHLDNFKFGE